jgi:hypothetical protein
MPNDLVSEDPLDPLRDEIKAYKEQLDVLKQDVEVIIRNSPNLIEQVRNRVADPNLPQNSPAILTKCEHFLQRWEHVAAAEPKRKRSKRSSSAR